MGEFKSWRKESRSDWGTTLNPGEQVTTEHLRTGAILRIADAVEKMVLNVSQLEAERDRYKTWYKDCRRREEHLERRVRGLRGVITRQKKRLDRFEIGLRA